MKKRCKKGVMQLPFGMIFSIILIVVFIAVAVYAINMFMNMKKCTNIGMFKQDFQEAVDRAWVSESSSEIFKGNLPGGISEVCFVDLSSSASGKNKEYYSQAQLYFSEQKNIFFWPLEESCEGLESFEIKHIDIEKTSEQENPHCISGVNGKFELKIEKEIYDALVKVS